MSGRAAALLLAASLGLLGCGQRAGAPVKGPEPWGALVSPQAALKVVFDEVCLPAVLEGRPVGELALSRHMLPVDPRRAGSPTATQAWRLASYSEVYVFALPNGGCSASVEAGSAEDLHAAAVSQMRTRRPDFSLGLREVADGAAAERSAYCTSEADRPYAVALMKKVGRSRRPAFLANVFRTQRSRPSFCNPS